MYVVDPSSSSVAASFFSLSYRLRSWGFYHTLASSFTRPALFLPWPEQWFHARISRSVPRALLLWIAELLVSLCFPPFSACVLLDSVFHIFVIWIACFGFAAFLPLARSLLAPYERIPDHELRFSASYSVFVISKAVSALRRYVGHIYCFFCDRLE